MRAQGRDIVLIGHAGHPEVMARSATRRRHAPGRDGRPTWTRLAGRDPARSPCVTQTTLSVDDTRAIVAALKRRFPAIAGPKKDDICYATQNRQDAVKRWRAQADVVLVVGCPNSSNSNRLREVARERGVPAYMVDRADRAAIPSGRRQTRVGVTAGASAPEVLVQEVLARLAELGAGDVARARWRRRARRVPAAQGSARARGDAKAPEVGPPERTGRAPVSSPARNRRPRTRGPARSSLVSTAMPVSRPRVSATP